MSLQRDQAFTIPSEQEAIQAKCFHPSGSFDEFRKEEIEQSIPCRFEQMVRRYPNRIAVKTKSHVLTYAELNATSNRVARAILDRCGERQEQIVLLLEHDAPMIAAILGVLKAGKIYVPLDPSYPLSRNTYILRNSQAGLMVTNNKNLSLAKELVQNALPLINIDNLDARISTKNPVLFRSPDAVSYILYTSGSTGKPKGVVQNHRNVLHDIMQYTNTLHICPDDRMTLLYSYSVNGSVRGIFGALLNGAALYPLDIRKEGLAKLANFLIQEEITFYHSVPTVFRNFVATLTGKEKFLGLRLIRFGGERVLARDVELYNKHFPNECLLYTGMGATETGHVCQYFIDKQTQIAGSVVPAGYPVEDKEILLLDDAGEEIGFNRVGEIAVRSRYLSLGYWQNPDLTQAVFLPDPRDGGKRIYRTGDLGRMRPDGCLEHLGRKDFQVKIRGYRIEVAEIEMALLDLPEVEEAIVLAREDHPGDQRLVGYLVPRNQFALSVSKLRSFLKDRLPDYMVPSAFVMLNAMPLTPNGKVDRRSLPDPGMAKPELDTPFVAPRTPVEEELAQIWGEVMGIDHVGIRDNFLELGGHSLKATQIISRVINRFRVELPVKSLLEAPTVAEMAAVIAEHKGKKLGQTEMESILTELESLTEEEAERLLGNQNETAHEKN
jgi:amino acid adenylation domain-containing protein